LELSPALSARIFDLYQWQNIGTDLHNIGTVLLFYRKAVSDIMCTVKTLQNSRLVSRTAVLL